jgi:hypothetical protein
MARFVSSVVLVVCAACSAAYSSTEDPSNAPPPRNIDNGQLDSGGSFDDDAGDHGSGSHPPVDASTDGDAAGGLDSGLVPKSTFTDDFARPNGNTIGNGWVPKIAKWSLSNGQVLEASSTATYKDLLVHRPYAEAARDVEVSVDATLPGNGGDVGLYARVQSASDANGTLIGYTFYPGDFGVAYVDHDIGTGTTLPVSSMGLNPPLIGGQTIHLTLRVTGAGPVHIFASIQNTSGQVLGSLSIDDPTANPITVPGATGFGSGGGGSRFDNFKVVTY